MKILSLITFPRTGAIRIGGMIESNFNLIDRLKTIEGMVEDAWFHRLDEWHFYPGCTTDLSAVINHSDKFAVCCWPTG